MHEKVSVVWIYLTSEKMFWLFCFELNISFKFYDICIIIIYKVSSTLFDFVLGHTCDYKISYLPKHKNRAIKKHPSREVLKFLRTFHL